MDSVIKNMVKSGRLPGAFIFEGSPDMTDSFADILAKAVVCADFEYKKAHGLSCGVCSSCRKSGGGTHPDIIITEPESDGARSFHIDKVRGITGGLYLSPNESDKKVYIIRDMQNMTQQGQNALLKSIEEPPPFVIFIITAVNLDLLLETVKSRAVKFSVGDDSARAQDNNGEIIKNILGKNTDRLAACRDMLKNTEKPGILNFYHNLENAARDILIAKVFADDLSGARFLYLDNPESYAGDYSVKKLFELCGKIQGFKSDLEHNANTRLNISAFFSAIV